MQSFLPQDSSLKKAREPHESASWNETLGRGGLGWIVRDSDGSLVYFGMQKITRKSPIQILEAKAILAGLKHIVGTCNQRSIPLEVESDALEVVNVIVGAVEDLSDLKPITNQISDIATNSHEITFRHWNRLLNTVAHCVAKNAAINPSIVDGLEESQASGFSREWGFVFWAPFCPHWIFPLLNEGRCNSVDFH